MMLRTKKLVVAALFAALACAATMAVRIPISATGGYIHSGDAVVILCGAFLNPWPAFLAAGLGAAGAGGGKKEWWQDMKFVLIPDSFKGTLSSPEICEILRERIEARFPGSEIVGIPVADGGEGSVDAFLAAVGGEKICEAVKNPYFEDMEAFYGLTENGRTAIVEMAACAGLPLVGDLRDPRRTTTYGVGQLMLSAARRGAKRIVVGLGGSATNDGGCGAAAAAGVKFYDRAGNSFVPVGGTLADIASMDLSGLDPALKKAEIVAMCDIDNPMCGPLGASFVFGPQKGAGARDLEELDRGMRHLSEQILRASGLDVSEIPGAGAAGAMGAGMVAFFRARLQMGIQTVLDTVRFDEQIADADFIFTGEGRLDAQSLRGKAVIGIAKRASKQGKPVIAIVGGADDREIEDAYARGVSAVFPINRLPQDFSVSGKLSRENLAYTADNILRLLRAAGRE